MLLSLEQRVEYEESGSTIVEGLIPPGLLRKIGDHLDRAALGELNSGIGVQVEPEVQRENIQPENYLDRIRKVSRLVPNDEFFAAVATNERILACMRDLLGENLRFFGDEAQLKPAHYGSAHHWHQDAPYFYVKPIPACTVWIAVDDATEQNGCLEVVPGRHKCGILERSNPDQAWFEKGEFDTSQAVPVTLKAGDGLFFHLCLPHGSKANTSTFRRRSLIYRYVNVDRIAPDMIPTVMAKGHLGKITYDHPIFESLSTD